MNEMTPAEAHKLFQENKAVIVDVREEDELRESGTAEGAIHAPLSWLAEGMPEWQNFRDKLPKDKTIALFCKSGGRSGRAAEFLAQDGFKTVNIGGFSAWKGAGLPVKKFG